MNKPFLKDNPTVLANTINSMAQTAEKLGANRENLLCDAGIDYRQLIEPDNRFPVNDFFKLCLLTEQRTQSYDVGLYAGRIAYTNRLNLQLYMSTICNTFREYLNVIPSALAYAGDVGEVKVVGDGPYIRLDWIPLQRETGELRYLSDMFLSMCTTIANTLCIRPIPVIKACFTYPEPNDLSLLNAIFGHDLTFNHTVSCLYFERESLNYPVAQLDYELNKALTVPLQPLFEDNHAEDNFLSELQRKIICLLPTGDLYIDHVAADLNISRRTLQRRLSDRNTQFLHVLQNTRTELAKQYLADKHLGITDIAFLLGYADQGTFSSAFKGWLGCSPSEYRRR